MLGSPVLVPAVNPNVMAEPEDKKSGFDRTFTVSSDKISAKFDAAS